MATLDTLFATADGTVGPRDWDAQDWALIEEGISGADGSIISRSTGTPGDTDADTSFQLTDVNSDFGNMDALSFQFRYAINLNSSGDDTVGLEVRIMSGATVLAAAAAGGGFQTVLAEARTPTSLTTGSVTAFGFTNTTATKAQWDAAEVEIRNQFTQFMSPDTNKPYMEVDTFEFTGTYTAAGSTFVQRRFRGREILGVLNKAYEGGDPAEDANFSMDMDVEFELRFKVEETGGAGSTQFLLQYSKNSGTWTDVPDVVDAWPLTLGGVVGVTNIVDTSDYADGDAATELLTALAGTYVNGTGEEDNLTTAWNNPNDNGEWVWRLVIPRYYDAGFNSVGDTFDFRMKESGGDDLTYDQTPRVTAALAVGHIGGVYIEGPGRIGPFRDANGNLYIFTEQTNQTNVLILHKSTDGGVTWNKATATGNPIETDPEGVEAFVVDDDILHIIHRGGSDDIFYHRYNMSSAASNPDTWQVIDEVIDADSGGKNNSVDSASIVVRANGDRFAFYNGLVSTFGSIYMRVWEGASWSARTDIDTEGSTHFNSVSAILDSNDDIQVYYFDFTNGIIYHQEIASGGVTLSGEGSRTAQATGLRIDNAAYAANMMNVASYLDGSVDVEVLGYYKVGVQTLSSTHVRDGTAQTEQSGFTDNTVNRNGGTSRQPVADFATEDTKLHIMYSGPEGPYDIYTSSDDDEAGWITDTEEQDAVTCQYIRTMVFTHSGGNGGDVVLGYVWEFGGADGQSPGFVRYDEIVLVAGGGQTIVVGTLAEADALVGAQARKIAPVGVLAETNPLVGAQAIKVAPVGVLASTDALVGVQARKIADVGVLAETDVLIVVGADKPIITAVGVLAEADSLVTTQPIKIGNVGTLAETDGLVAIEAVKPIITAVGVLAESEVLLTVTGLKTVTLGTLAEVESLLAIEAEKPIITAVGVLAETDVLVPTQPLKVAVVGTLAEIDALITAAVAQGQVIAVTVIAESDSLIVVQPIKVAAVGTLAETDGLIAVEAVKLIVAAVGVIAETDSPVGIQPIKVGIVGTISETETLIAIQAVKPIITSVGVLAESEVFLAVVPTKVASVGTLAEVEALLAIAGIKVASVGTLSEIETLVAVTGIKIAAVGTLAETDSLIAAVAVQGQVIVVTTVAEADSLIVIQPLKVATVGTLAEIDAPVAVAADKPIITAVGTFAEIDALRSVQPLKVAVVGTLAEIDALLPIDAVKPIITTVGVLNESDTLVAITGIKVASVGTLTTVESLIAASPLKTASVGVLAEVETLLAVSGIKTVSVGTVAEVEALLAAVATKVAAIGSIAETETLISVSPAKVATIGTLSEVDTLIAIAAELGSGQTIAVGVLVEIETLLAVAGIKIVQVGTLTETDALVQVLPTKIAQIGTMEESDSLVAADPVKPIVVGVGTLTEVENLLAVAGAKIVAVGTLAELESLLAVAGLKTADVGVLAEIESLLSVGAEKPIVTSVGVMSETDVLVAVASIIGVQTVLFMRVTSGEYDTTQVSKEYDDTQTATIEGT